MDRPPAGQRRTDGRDHARLFCGPFHRSGGRRFLRLAFRRRGLRLRRFGFNAFMARLTAGFLGRRFGLRRLRLVLGLRDVIGNIVPVETAQFDRHVLIDRAGVRLLFRNAQLGKPVQYLVGLHFQLPCQLVNPNLLHR
jgi:hypothetical protein